MKRIIPIALALVLVLAPAAVFAVDPPPCDGITCLVPCDGPDCDACKLVELGQNIMVWIVSVMAVLIAIVIVFAGLNMVMSAGNTGKVTQSKGMMTNAIVGFVILLASWLIIDTVMKTFVDVDNKFKFGMWNKIECVPLPPPPPTRTTPPTACSIPPLSPLSDPLAIRMEGGQTVIWDNTSPELQPCVNKFLGIVKAGSVTSAYRPQEYQNHLIQLKDRWCNKGLQSNSDPACSALKTEIQADFSKHQLNCNYPIATVSNHTAGTAVDISNLAHGTTEVKNAASASCLTWFGESDPVHYTLKSSCSCQ